MFSGTRTRRASPFFVPAFATEDAPRLIAARIDAINNAEIFLNILPPQNTGDIPPVVSLNDLSGLVLGCFHEHYGWSERYRTAGGSKRVHNGGANCQFALASWQLALPEL